MKAKSIGSITGHQFDVAVRHLNLEPREYAIAFGETYNGRMRPYLLLTPEGPDIVVAYPPRKLYGMGIEQMVGARNVDGVGNESDISE